MQKGLEHVELPPPFTLDAVNGLRLDESEEDAYYRQQEASANGTDLTEHGAREVTVEVNAV